MTKVSMERMRESIGKIADELRSIRDANDMILTTEDIKRTLNRRAQKHRDVMSVASDRTLDILLDITCEMV